MGPNTNQPPVQQYQQPPTQQYQQPAQPQQPVAWPQQPMPPKKKSLLWLWITLGVLFLAIIGLVVAFFVIKSSADSAASDYTSSVKAYVKDVADKAKSSTGDPADAKKAIEGLSAPTLKDSFMGETVSSSYKSAVAVKSELTGKVKTLTDKFSDYASGYKFYKDDIAIEAEATAATSGTSAISKLTGFQDWLKKYQAFIDGATVPSDLADTRSAMSASNKKMLSAWNDLVTAYNNLDKSSYETAYNSYITEGDNFKDIVKAINTYYKDLQSKTDSAASEFQSYADTIK